MSDNVCPKCGKLTRVVIGTFYENDNGDEIKTLKVGRKNWDVMIEERDAALAEISRLKAALEKAEMERDSNKFLLGVYKGGFASGRSERDEARRWALYYQKLAQKWQDKYEDTKKRDSRYDY